MAGLAAYVLEHGLNQASLRPMAAALGTSDRMLLYYFGTKDALIAELLVYLAEGMAQGLEAALPPQRYEDEAALLRDIVGLMRTDVFQPYTQLWFDILASAHNGSAAHQHTAHRIMNVFLDWITVRHPQGAAGAPRLLLLIEGAVVLDAAGHKRVTDAGLGIAKE
ncbi:MAG: TetR/AcrR family transcriptional regulator [Pseudomonadota bacterium]